jgi:hypothetical protein
MPLAVAPGTRVGINRSGCYGDAADVPAVVSLTVGATVTLTMHHCPQ